MDYKYQLENINQKNINWDLNPNIPIIKFSTVKTAQLKGRDQQTM